MLPYNLFPKVLFQGHGRKKNNQNSNNNNSNNFQFIS